MDNDTMVAVTQADRDAAAEWLWDPESVAWDRRDFDKMKSGSWDDHSLIQAFARHRHQSETGAGEADCDPSKMSVEMAELFGLVCKLTRLKAEHDDMLRSGDGLAAIERAADKLDEIVDAMPLLKSAFAKVHAREEKYRAALAQPVEAGEDG